MTTQFILLVEPHENEGPFPTNYVEIVQVFPGLDLEQVQKFLDTSTLTKRDMEWQRWDLDKYTSNPISTGQISTREIYSYKYTVVDLNG